MSVIQQIQDKYAKLMAIVIAVALIIFIVMLAFENGNNILRGSNSNVVGKVNGEEIEYNSFRQMVDQYENYYKQQYGGTMNGYLQQQALTQAWDAEVNRLLLKSEIDKLGLQIGKKELGSVLYGENPPPQLRQAASDESGNFDPIKAKQLIDQASKGTPEQKASVNELVSQSELQRLGEKYNSLLSSSVNVPRWMVEKENAANSQLSKISFVREVYASIPDSTIQVSDKEIEEFINKHKEQFKQPESRSIEYVTFSARPTASDSAASLKEINGMKAEFDSTADPAAMITRNSSAIPYSDVYISKTELHTANQQMNLQFKDTIQTLAKNAVYGPYLDGSNYILAKMLDTKVLPDSVKCRHILIATTDRQGQPAMDDSVAHHLIDSIAGAIRNGSSFDSLEAKFSMGGSEHQNKGVMTFSSTEIQSEGFAPEFGKFILFDGKPGDKKVLKTRFGWHYIEIMNFIKPEDHYKIAYLARPIEASAETDAAANTEAQQFAATSRDLKSFDANAEKLKSKGINKLSQPNISPTDFHLPMGDARAMIKAIYAADQGDVLPPQRVGDDYVVAVVTEVNKEGTASVQSARQVVTGMLRNHKKAELLAKKAGTTTTLEAVAAAWGGKQIEVADSLRFAGTTPSAVSAEPKVIGAAFNPANKGKVTSVIEGIGGVYVVRVEDITTTSLLGDANVANQRKAQADQQRNTMMQMAQQGYQPLKDAASIKDNRVKFF